ncbi:MAG: DUF3846 domain-containing protein [Candidatus Spyradocola sp.]
MKEDFITALHLPPHERPRPVSLENTLDGLQTAVGGLIEFVYLSDSFMLLVNEEGKLLELEPNRRLGCDVLVGDVYVVKDDGEGDLTSLSPEELEMLTAAFYEPAEDITAEEAEAAAGFLFFPC